MALKLVLDQIGLVAPDIGHIPTILRCAIRLTVAEIEGSRESEAAVESLCLLLEKGMYSFIIQLDLELISREAAEQAKRSRQKARDPGKQGEIAFTVKELDWFSRNGYNIGLRSIVEWPLSRSLGIISICIRFLDLYPDDIDGPKLAEISYRRLLCNYLCACISVELARVGDNIEVQLQHYLVSRHHVQEFRSRRDSVQRKAEDEIEDLEKKFRTLLGYDFEAAVRLKDWESLRGIVEEAALCTNKGISIFETITDILISSEAPSRIKLIIMQVILNYIVPSPMADVVKLSRWIRTLVQLSIAKDPKVTEALLVEVTDVMKNRSDGQRYPNEEVQWLTGRLGFFLSLSIAGAWGFANTVSKATAWNRSVDFHWYVRLPFYLRSCMYRALETYTAWSPIAHLMSLVRGGSLISPCLWQELWRTQGLR